MTDMDDLERRRLAALARYDVMDTPREPAFDEVAALAAKLCDAPIAVVNLIGDGRQFFKAEVGLGVRETPLESSFCAKAILEQDFLLVPDATQDARFDCNPLVIDEPHLRFYAGALLKTEEGLPIGTLCVLDTRPKQLSELQQETLRVLARQVMAQFELRRALEERSRQLEAAEASERRLRQTQIELADSEARFRNMADNTPVMMWVTDPDGACTYLNRVWYEFTGQSEEEVRGFGWLDTTHPDDRAAAEQAFLAANAARQPFRLEYRLRRADGTYRWAIDAATPRFADDGSYLGYVGSVIDIDDRREAEDELRRAKTLLEAVMEAVPGVVYAKDRDGRMLAANRGTVELVGKPLNEIAVILFAEQWRTEGQDVQSLTLPDRQDALIDAVAAANPRTVVVLETGGAVLMPWRDRVAGIVQAFYPGSGGAEAIAGVLFGRVNPSGRLPYTIPAREAQLPRPQQVDPKTVVSNPGQPVTKPPVPIDFDVEGADVGYRWFSRRGETPLYPFGYGLSYTRFGYAGLRAVSMPAGSASVSVDVTNQGLRAGSEVVQIYAVRVGDPSFQPRLVGFDKLALEPGQTRTATVTVEPRLLARATADGWARPAGEFRFEARRDALTPATGATLRLPAWQASFSDLHAD